MKIISSLSHKPTPIGTPVGVGEYSKKISNLFPIVKKSLLTLALAILLSTYVTATVLTGLICPISLIATVPIGAGLAGLSIPAILILSAKTIFEIYRKIKYNKTLAPSTSLLGYDKFITNCPKINQWDNKISEAAVLKDPIETFKLKKQLIENAEQEILISGSYCGRKAFDLILDAIEKRMEERPNLRVSILSAKRFITDKKEFGCSNWKKIKNLTEKYPDRFFLTISYETLQNNPYSDDFKYISNHMKLMIVDRKVLITGGSGIEDRWMSYDGLSDMDEKNEGNHGSQIKESFVNSCIAKSFRDKDTLMYSDSNKSLIETSVFEFYKLMTRWHHYESTAVQDKNVKEIAKKRKNLQLKPFHDFYKPIDRNGPRIDLSDLNLDPHRTFRPERCKFFASGPEMKENLFEKELVNLFKNAKKSITLNHMYFHPTKAIFNELAKALKRGVKITFITNTYNENSPKCHKIFAPRTFYYLRKLNRYNRNNNLQVYAWNKKLVTNHQKLIVVDDRYLVSGSSNFSYKGLVSMSDYEHNVVIDSKDLCETLKEDFDIDKSACVKVSNKDLSKFPSVFDIFRTAAHTLLERKIG